MGQTPWPAVINLSNSIIGVSVLAMPWCFKECGIILGIVMLLSTGVVNKFSCNLLLRASKATRKTSYEFLAYHTLGSLGKLTVEISLILLLLCTCIAFFVIIGDLFPAQVAKWTGLENTSNLRTSLLIGTAVFIVLPLSHRRNIESLSGLSTISIAFYVFFATTVFIDSLPKVLTLEWVTEVSLWRTSGLLKGSSIFAMSLCCQPTIFAVYESLQERTPKMMEDVVSKGINLVATVYVTIGIFGYITYFQDGIKGDILLNFPPSLLADVLSFLFVFSVALSFPLIVFPCRSSIYSLLFPNSADSGPVGGVTYMYIPSIYFRMITCIILGLTLTIGILVPNVEKVLSLTGSTMGSLAAFILPAFIYLHAVGVPSKSMAKVLLVGGFILMLCSTYDNIRPTYEETPIPAPVQVFDKLPDVGQDNVPLIGVDKDKQHVGGDDAVEKPGLQGDDVIKDRDQPAVDAVVGDGAKGGQGDTADEGGGKGAEEQPKDHVEAVEGKRQEPPIPHAPIDVKPDKDKTVEDIIKKVEQQAEEKIRQEELEKEREDREAEDGDGAGDQADKDADVADLLRDDTKEDTKEKKEKEEGEGEGDGEEHDDTIVEQKVKVQEEKQEQQEKKLEELQVRQAMQEKLIVQQAEELDRLKKEHQEEKVKKEVEDLQKREAELAAAAVQPLAGQLPVQPVAGQPLAGQPVAGQQLAGQPVAGQLPVGQLPVQPVAGQAVAGQPLAGQPVGGQPVAGQAVGGQQLAGQLPVQPVAGQPVAVQQVVAQPIGGQPLAAQPVGGQPAAGQQQPQQPQGQQQVQQQQVVVQQQQQLPVQQNIPVVQQQQPQQVVIQQQPVVQQQQQQLPVQQNQQPIQVVPDVPQGVVDQQAAAVGNNAGQGGVNQAAGVVAQGGGQLQEV